MLCGRLQPCYLVSEFHKEPDRWQNNRFSSAKYLQLTRTGTMQRGRDMRTCGLASTEPNHSTCIWSYNHGQKSWDTFAFLGRFPIHTGPTPPLTPQTMLNFFRVSTLYRVGGGRTARKFRKGCTVLRGTEKWQKNLNIAVLCQGLLSRIVGLNPTAEELVQ